MELPMFYNDADEWNQALLLYDSALKEINTKLEILRDEFKLAHSYNPIEHITSRIKSPQSIAKKMRHKGLKLTTENIIKYLNDVAGIRIICSFTSDIFRIAGLIAKQSDVRVLKIKDYITTPKANGYMSYHMIVSVPIFLSENVIDTKVEIQIRTIAMDFWASLEHKIYYKFEGNAPERIRSQLKECADVVAYLDQKMLSINEEVQSYHHADAETARVYQSAIKEYYGKIYSDVPEDTKQGNEQNQEEPRASYSPNVEDDDLTMINRIEKAYYEKGHSKKEPITVEASPVEDDSDIVDGIIHLSEESKKNDSQEKGKKEGITSFFFRKKDKKSNTNALYSE